MIEIKGNIFITLNRNKISDRAVKHLINTLNKINDNYCMTIHEPAVVMEVSTDLGMKVVVASFSYRALDIDDLYAGIEVMEKTASVNKITVCDVVDLQTISWYGSDCCAEPWPQHELRPEQYYKYQTLVLSLMMNSFTGN